MAADVVVWRAFWDVFQTQTSQNGSQRSLYRLTDLQVLSSVRPSWYSAVANVLFGQQLVVKPVAQVFERYGMLTQVLGELRVRASGHGLVTQGLRLLRRLGQPHESAA